MVIVLIISALGALSTYELSKHSKIGSIRASAGASLLFAIVSPLIFIESDSEALTAIFFGASFVGMSSEQRLSRAGVLWAGILFGVIYWLIAQYVSGIGGALGFSAFISVSLTLLKLETLSLVAKR